MDRAQHSAEHQRLQEAREHKVPWNKWGPYLSERQAVGCAAVLHHTVPRELISEATVLDMPNVRAWGDKYNPVLQRGLQAS